MTSPFIQGLAKAIPNQQKLPVRQSLPAPNVMPVTTSTGSGKKPYNPFIAGLNKDSDEFNEVYGVNKPLREPAFFGYHDGRELKGGGRLFMLY